ncbi:hypothetical protein [Sulfuracidifex tepidarius]|uniref:DUF4149 domain-containing protein n=1 Tax=Sulfuracidifex tepidarius TaxID=1294262 RepID=A0A510DSJ2_9CREN|nr:hypothetical protein [Sulfuracidifex tepidarius]BBG23124.1 hypothetical protein IC006_0408 [Sulfuracidifex tepidarius]BBG25874.1 hypothetical protein IC007_0379 [Sulfuracidifex tepidarius]
MKKEISEEKDAIKVKWVTPRGVLALVIPITGLITAYVLNDIILLDYVHVMSGLLWTGIDIFMGFVLSYTLKSLDPKAKADVARSLTPTMLFLMPSIATVAVTSGYILASEMGIFSLSSPLIISAVIIIAILMIQGFGIFLPNEVRVVLELNKDEPSYGKIGKLMMINFKLSGVQGILQLLLIFVMAHLAI